MADGRKAGSSGNHRYYTRRSRKPKESEVVLSDSSSSESTDEDLAPACPVQPSHKSIGANRTNVENPDSTPECPVCLQPCIHPARLPCGHIFCFLCLKGIAQQSRRCAMCRQEISLDYLDRPDLLEVPETRLDKGAETLEDGYQWFYEGRNGWWQYDERTSKELEASYKSGIRTCELLIAGFLYTADFDAMVQVRRNEPHRRRRIKRDLATIPSKGIAGIRSTVNIDTVSEQLSSLTLSDSANEQEES